MRFRDLIRDSSSSYFHFCVWNFFWIWTGIEREGEEGRQVSRNRIRQGGEQFDRWEMTSQASGDILLRVYIHCSGCEETVVKCLRGFDGNQTFLQ